MNYPIIKNSTLKKNLNQQISNGFYRHRNNDAVKKTHEFDGRYENIYLTEQHIPELAELIAEAITYAQEITGEPQLKAGYWFNDMPPGSTTTLHRHDDFDELLSAVYYVLTPVNCGNLSLFEGDKRTEITPEAGNFVFFKPDVPHEVSMNKSNENRLSIGINFGPVHGNQDLTI